MRLLYSLGDVVVYPRTKAKEIILRSSKAEVIITNKVVLQEEHFKQLPELKLIVLAATGFNNIDINAAREYGISVCNVRGYSTESVVQHTFSLMLGLLNRVEHYDKKVKEGKWASCEDFSFYDHSITELSGKVLGIIGYGTIGKRVAQIGAAFGMTVLAYRRNPKGEYDAFCQMVSLIDLYKRSDIISCHAPLNEDSYQMINKRSLAIMKPSAIIINTARGGLINEEDLSKALVRGVIAGAGLDTLSAEPPQNNPLIDAPRCLITPHQAWASKESRIQLIEGMVKNIKGYQDGKLINVVN